MAGPYKLIHFDRSAGIAALTLDRPPVNVLNIEMMGEMLDALGAIDPRETKILLIKANGKAFSAGVEVAEHLGHQIGPMLENFHGLFRRLAKFDFPIVASVHGACLGGGCELISICDFVIATEDAKLGQPEIKLGVFPPLAAILLPRRIGELAANDLILTGRVISSAEAWDMGLLWKVVPADQLEEETRSLMDSLAGLSGPALRFAKRAIRAPHRREFLENLAAAEAIYLDELMKTEDAEEGLRSFLEKREPVWKDR